MSSPDEVPSEPMWLVVASVAPAVLGFACGVATSYFPGSPTPDEVHYLSQKIHGVTVYFSDGEYQSRVLLLRGFVGFLLAAGVLGVVRLVLRYLR